MKMNRILSMIAIPLFIHCTSNAIEPITRNHPKPAPAPLQVQSVVPSWGYAYDRILINGLGFVQGARVFIGDQECINTNVIDTWIISCHLPAQEEFKDYPVYVINPDGTKRPIALNEEEIKVLKEEEDEDSDGLIYFYYVKPFPR